MDVLFVCTGNTCRSPLAEAIARRLASERGLEDVRTASAGTSAWEGAAASDGAVLVAIEHDLDLSTHRARVLSREQVAKADLILTMSPHHRDRAVVLGGAGKTHLLTDYAARADEGRPISDPFGGELGQYRQTCEELILELQRVFERLVAERGTGHA